MILEVFYDLDDGAEGTLRKFADDKLGGVADTPESHAATQRDFGRLERWADRNLLQLSKDKCRVLHLRRNTSIHQYCWYSLSESGSATKGCPGPLSVGFSVFPTMEIPQLL